MSNVKLIAVTKPSDEYSLTSLSAEDLIAYCARVSNPSNQENFSTASKLLRYCIKNKHWSIFEMAHVVMEINTTRDIARQILRHRSFSFQEFSQRYADASHLGFETREARLQDSKNRQNSIDTSDVDLQKTWEAKQQQMIHESNLAYKWALENGIAKEQARAVLPEGLTKSRLYMSGSLRSWITFIATREKPDTQKEHRQIALECKKIIAKEFPSIADALSQKDEQWII
jgi:thymidylate synthase (FAD)